MKKTALILIIFLILLTGIGLGLYIYSKSLNNSVNIDNSKNSSSSYPSNYSSNSSSSKIFNADFYKSYISSTDKIKLITLPYIDGNFEHYFHFTYGIEKSSNYANFVLVDASTFKTGKELYEKMYSSITPVGSLVSSRELQINNLTLSMALMNLPMGNGKYFIIGGIKDGDKGYYFEEYIGEYGLDLNNDQINNIFNHSYSATQKEYFKIVNKVVLENIPKDYFHTFINNKPKEIIDSWKKSNNGTFPTTF